MKKLLLLGTVLLHFSCASTKVLNSEAAAQVDWGKYTTFDFYKLSASGDTVTAGFADRVEKIKNAITQQLQLRGFTQTSSQPDLLVNIGILIKEKTQTRTTDFRTDGLPMYIGQRNYSWKSEEIEIGRYREGTATVHIVDATAKKMLWRGVVQDILPDKEAKLDKTIQEGAKALFAQFPVAPTK